MATSTIKAPYEDISSSIAVYGSRVNVSKQQMRKYLGGRIEVYVEGTFASSLTSSQQSLFTVALALADNSVSISGTANIAGTSYFVFGSTAGGGANYYINIAHNGVTENTRFSLYATWY